MYYWVFRLITWLLPFSWWCTCSVHIWTPGFLLSLNILMEKHLRHNIWSKLQINLVSILTVENGEYCCFGEGGVLKKEYDCIHVYATEHCFVMHQLLSCSFCILIWSWSNLRLRSKIVHFLFNVSWLKTLTKIEMQFLVSWCNGLCL